MIFGLDWDGTVTGDQELWETFVRQAKARGHQVVIVTMRYNNEPISQTFVDIVDGVIYTGRRAKKRFVKALGVPIDVWIDDNPVFLFEDASL